MKTNSILFSIFFISLSNFLCAQIDSVKKNNAFPKWEIGLAYNSVEAQMDQKLFDTWVFPSANYYAYFGNKNDRSFSISAIPKYFLSDDVQLRCEFGFTNINMRSYYNGAGDTLSQNQGHIGATGSIIKQDTIQQKIFRFVPGIQWTLTRKKRVKSYGGISLCYNYYSKMHWGDFITSLPDTTRRTDYIATTKGGFQTGIGLFGGFTVRIYKQIYLGGELSYYLLYYKLGGIQKGEMINYYTSSATEVLLWSIYDNSSKGVQFSKVIPSFRLCIRI